MLATESFFKAGDTPAILLSRKERKVHKEKDGREAFNDNRAEAPS